MQLKQGQRVIVEKASGGRKKFNGQCGEIVDIHDRGREGTEPFVFVDFDGEPGPRIFLPSELRAEEKTRNWEERVLDWEQRTLNQ